MDDSATTRAAVRQTAEAVRSTGVEFRSTVDDPAGRLTRHRRHATTARVPALGVPHGRPLPDHVDLTASNATILCTGSR